MSFVDLKIAYLDCFLTRSSSCSASFDLETSFTKAKTGLLSLTASLYSFLTAPGTSLPKINIYRWQSLTARR